MTRKDAINIAKSFNLLERHVEYLEALGLLKFEKIKEPREIVGEVVVEDLNKAGYEIVRKK